MTDPLNDLAADAAAAYDGGVPYTYAAQDALDARVLIVEEGGAAFPKGVDIGAPDDDVTGKWQGILGPAGFEPGMYSWWNAIPCGLDRSPTAQDKSRGRSYLMRAIALHRDLHVVVAVGAIAREVVRSAGTTLRVLEVRSPLRCSKAETERIREMFVRARMDAYPIGYERH